MSVYDIDEAILGIVPIATKFHLSKKEISNGIRAKLLNQFIWFESIA